MRNDFPKHSLPPLSTRMIFLHHRVRMHHRFHHGSAGTQSLSFAVRLSLLALAATIVVLIGVFHA